MEHTHPLRAIFEEAARGRLAEPNGDIRVLSPGRSQAVRGFTALQVIHEVGHRTLLASLAVAIVGAIVVWGSWRSHEREPAWSPA